MHSRNRLHQVGSWVVTKVRAHVTYTQTSTTGFQILWMLISWFVQCIDLWEEQQRYNVTTRETLCFSNTHCSTSQLIPLNKNKKLPIIICKQFTFPHSPANSPFTISFTPFPKVYQYPSIPIPYHIPAELLPSPATFHSL